MQSGTKTVLLMAILLTPAVFAEDWPNWRGPNFNGISNETGWFPEAGAVEPNELWEQQLGIGFSSISIADGRLFTMGNIEIEDGRETLDCDQIYCLDPNTGKEIWKHKYPARLDPQSYEGGPSATPTVVDCNVYTLSKRGIACCLDVNDGTVHWEVDLKKEHGVRWPTWKFSGSPYVIEGLVIYNVGTHGLALQAVDGALAWSTGTGRCGYSTPMPYERGDLRMVLLAGERTYAGVEIFTGQVIWEHSWTARYQANIPDPIIDGNSVFLCGSYNDRSTLFEIEESGLKFKWSSYRMQNFMNSCVLWEGYLYGHDHQDDTLTCMEFATGALKWKKDLQATEESSLMLADGKLIVLTDRGKLHIVKATPQRYDELAQGRILAGRCWTVPVLANGKIYARNASGTLVCVELQPVQGAGRSR